MRFIGGKSLLLPYIKSFVKDYKSEIKTVSDLFSGSGVVSQEFKKLGFNTISNDLMYFCYVLLRGTLPIFKLPEFKKLGIENPIEYLNNLEKDSSLGETFMLKKYSPKGQRMYFTEENAFKIDLIRSSIEHWKKNNLINDDEYFYLLACLLEAVPYISNIAGVYGAYLKFWDERAKNDLILKKPNLIKANTTHEVYHLDANELVRKIEVDLAYYDPPYNQRQYLPNYHILETIAKYDYPEIKGVTGLRAYDEEKSRYCYTKDVYDVFDDLIKNTKAKYILISYNTEGLLSKKQLIEMLSKHCKQNTIEVQKVNYSRYKNAHTQNDNNLKELLFFAQMK